MTRTLVTGGCGFIGANVVRALLESGRTVRILDDLSTGDAAYVAGLPVEVVRGDVRDADAVTAAVRAQEEIVHLAGETSVGGSLADPRRAFDVNVGGTLTLLLASRDAGARRFVYASSNAAIGEAEPPLAETVVPRPLSPYGASKLAAEACCSAFAASFGLGTTSLRFANVYGPYSGHKTSVVAKMVRQIAIGGSVTVYGDGKQTRDFVFVADIVRAIILSLDADVRGEVLHIGTGVETSVLELVDKLFALMGAPREIRWLPQPPGEIRRNYSSIARARERIGYRPSVDLDTGLSQAVRWLTAALPSTPPAR